MSVNRYSYMSYVDSVGCFKLIACTVTGNFFFFFQAEDGIRDVAVTGVQTCALPILSGPTGDMT